MASSDFNSQYSPSRQKLQALSEKFQSIPVSSGPKESASRRNEIEKKLKELEERILKTRVDDEQKMRIIKENLEEIEKEIENERLSRENYDERKEVELKNLDEGFHSLLLEEKKVELNIMKNKKAIDGKLNKQLEEKIGMIQGSITRNSKTCNETKESRLKEVKAIISSLKEQLDTEKKKREDSLGTVQSLIEGELKKFQELMVIEKKVREETQNKIYKMIEELHRHWQSEIGQESSERITNSDSLLILLEDTCNRIDKAGKY